MSVPYFTDEQITLHHGDSLAVLREMPDASVDCCVTSPPYFGLRDYGQPGQYGLEASPAEYVETMRALFVQVRRVLTDEGTLWLNIGDSYVAARGQGNAGGNLDGGPRPSFRGDGASVSATRNGITYGLPNKNLLGIPWRTAFALQDDGWILRNDIVWSKPNAMPESVSDRLSGRHEYVFMFSKSSRYWFDLDPIREPLAPTSLTRLAQDVEGQHGSDRAHGGTKTMKAVSKRDSFARGTKSALPPGQSMVQHREDRPDVVAGSPLGRNPGDVWTIATQPFSEAHFAVMPQALAERAILAGCKPGGTVLDPFSGSGTTGLAATKHGRKYVGIDLSADYLDLSLRTRFAEPGFDFGVTA